MELDGHAFTMVGVPVQMKHASQRIDVAGSAGDVYSLGGWAKGDIAPMTDDGRSFCVLVQFISRLTAEFNGKKDRKYVYTYDSSGNITSKKEYRWSDNALLHTYNHTYGDATWGDLLTGYDGRTITSDAIGNMTNDGIWSYTWSHGRQVLQ